MILTCPNCGTQYVVKDGAIPAEGRQVRCAACKHSWHEDPQQTPSAETAATIQTAPLAEQTPEAESTSTREAAVPEAEPATDAESPERVDESFAEATLIEPRSGPEAEERSYEDAVIEGQTDAPEMPAAGSSESESGGPAVEPADWNEPPAAEPADDLYSPFADDEPRRRSPVLTILLLIAIVVAAAAAFWFFAPANLKAKLGIAQADATPLQSVVTHMERAPLESGNELLTVTGRVINPSGKEQEVPPIQAQLKSHNGKVVYSWTIEPPARSLGPGASASFNSAEVNVPAGGEQLTLTFGDSRSG